MIEVELSVDVLSRARFAYSPLAELAASVRLLRSSIVRPPHQAWCHAARLALRGVDLSLVQAAYPPGPFLADLLPAGDATARTTISDQLAAVARLPGERLRDELEAVWRSGDLPPAARRLIAAGDAGPARLAAAFGEYWEIAVAPHWPQIRSILSEDVSYRAARLAAGGLQELISDLHPEVSLRDERVYINKPHHADRVYRADVLVLIPSVFVWPQLILGHPPGGIVLTYGARGVGRLWESSEARSQDDALGALLGRSRAAILLRVGVPASTTQLADELGQSPPAVSQHLSVLRRNGLVSARRSGRSVLYQRTPLAASLVALSSPDLADEATAT